MKILLNRVNAVFFFYFIVLSVPIGVNHAVAETVSQFEREILSKPSVEQPSNPFVEIFLDAGIDGSVYGFQTGGEMSVDAWKRVFNHVGYLSAYSIFKPEAIDKWGLLKRDVAPIAALSLGRNIGGGIMGLPKTPTEIENVKASFRTDFGLAITHFFHDEESDFGLPGGSGSWRLKLAANDGYLKTKEGVDFFPRLDSVEDKFKVEFGVDIGAHIFGGVNYIIGNYGLGLNGGLNSGWAISIENHQGYYGNSYITFRTASGESVASLPLSNNTGRSWLNVGVEMQKSATPDFWSVTINIDNVGASSGLVRPLQASDVSPGFVVGNIAGQTRNVEIDDIKISHYFNGKLSIVAYYSLETTAAKFDVNEPSSIAQVFDESGNGFDLFARKTSDSGILITQTTGIDNDLGGRMKKYLVDDIFLARKEFSKPFPKLITNWFLSERPGRAKAWSNLGFTHGSATYYYNGYTLPSKTKLATVLLGRVPMELRGQADGDLWGHAWLGNANYEKDVLSSDEFSSLVVMVTLEGFRWLSDFVAMSGGHLGLANSSRENQVRANVEAIYAMAKAASWFQKTSAGLENSVYYPSENLISDGDVIIRSRINPRTGEMWFAGCLAADSSVGEEKFVDLHLPSESGVVTNMATESSVSIKAGAYRLAVSKTIVHPYYFKANAPFGKTMSAPNVRLKTLSN